MQDKEILIKEIGFAKGIFDVTKTYEETAVMEIQKVRRKTWEGRDFMYTLAGILQNILQYYRKEVDEYRSYRRPKDSVIVFISMSNKFSGDIASVAFSYFLKQVSGKDLIIIGEEGREMFKGAGENSPARKYSYFDFPLSEDSEKIAKITNAILEYQNIEIIYGKYISIITQKPEKTSLLGLKVDETLHAPVEILQYLFEPNLTEVLGYFEKEGSAVTFRQLLLESHLAELGSRINSMYTASSKIEKEVAKLESMLNIARKKGAYRKQLQGLAGMKLWERV